MLNLYDTSPLGVYIFEVNAYEIKGITLSRIGKNLKLTCLTGKVYFNPLMLKMAKSSRIILAQS